MQGDCKSSVKLCEMVNRFLEKYETNNLWQQKLKDSKEVIGNQMLGVSKILEELVNDLKVENTFEGDLKKLIQRELETQGIFIEDLDISDYQNETMISLNKKSCMGSQECMNKIVPILNQTLGQQFKVEWSSCGGNLGSNRCSLQIVPGPRYWVGTGVVQVSPDEEVVSGDDYKIIESDNEEFVSILSDGMGRGQRAALESRTTVSLLEKLIKAGFDKELAIKIINSTLLLRSTEEVFSTVDIKTIDCHNGEAEFVKIGSAPTFIKRNNREIDIIRGSSLPIGIIDNVGVESTQSLQLSPGDMVIMVTDGVLDAQEVETRQEEWMMRLLQNNLINDPQSLAEYIIEQAKETKNEISDDMTVLVAKLNGFQNK